MKRILLPLVLALTGCQQIKNIEADMARQGLNASPNDEYAKLYGFTNYYDEAKRLGFTCNVSIDPVACRQYVREQYKHQYALDTMTITKCDTHYDPENQNYRTKREEQQFRKSAEYLKLPYNDDRTV